jgi:regulator of protease activity HflC (stomatin/prohibitin superfamily)
MFFNIRFMKAPPTTYVLQYKRGRVKREGAGLAFFYYAPTSTIVAVPMASTDAPYVFNEATADFQAITIQGQLTYRIADPKRLAALLDHSLRADGKYASDDPQKLSDRLINTIQTLTRGVTGRLPLRKVLEGSDAICAEVLAALRKSDATAALGVEVLGLSILSLRPTPEMAKALEAEAREALQRRSDEAIYARRNAAVIEERRIKESELATEVAVEEKRRLIRETQMAGEIAVEQQRAALIDQRVANDRKDADSRAYALSATLKPIESLEWKKLMLLSGKGGDARNTIAMAFQELAGNAQKIGELNMSPDLLRSLLGK